MLHVGQRAYGNIQRGEDRFTNGDIIRAADLVEVSLMLTGNPAWYGTYAEAID